jgi:competence ComEA-like helix-hairpin-helix protein
MSDPEVRSLRAAVAVLVTLSAFRWVMAGTAPSGSLPRGDVEAHALATRAAAAEGERRGLTLDSGERVDPNRAPEIELDRLPGIGPATARAIVAARDSGITFRRANDLEEVRGIGPALVERIAPYLDLTVAAPVLRRRDGRRSGSGPVDINRADEAQLAELPGVGPVIARRIVSARRERPFSSVEDLVRVSGIGAATVTRLAGVATVGRGHW